MFFENIKLAFKDFGANKLRTFLSVLGIVIGVGSVITITTLGRSATASIKKEIAQAGLETITLFPGWRSEKEVRRLFTPELAERIKDEIEGINEVVPVNQGNYLLKYGRNSYECRVIAVNERYPEIFSYEAADGRFISVDDNRRRKSVIALGAEVADELFPAGDAVGRYIKLYRKQARSFKIIGVMKPRSDSLGVAFDTSAYVPYDTYTQRIQRIDTVQFYSIGTEKGADVLEVSKRLEDFFLDLTGNKDSYRIMSPSTIADMYTGITDTLNLFLTGIAAISLLVGGIGIMNIMLVSIAERTREIGIRKALGAAPAVIRGQFLTEAVCLTIFGGIIGMFIGTALSFLGTSLLNWSFAPQVSAYVLALVFSSSVGVFFGLYPAVRASRLDPIEALSFE